MTPPIIEMSIAPITNPPFTCLASLPSFHHHMLGPVKAGLTTMDMTFPSTPPFILKFITNHYAPWDMHYFCPSEQNLLSVPWTPYTGPQYDFHPHCHEINANRKSGHCQLLPCSSCCPKFLS